MQTGERVSKTPYILVDDFGRRDRRPIPGTVVYVHPKGRWYTVLFDAGFRESFWTDLPKIKEPMPPHGGWHKN